MTRFVLSLLFCITYGLADLPPVKTYKTINECQSDIYYGNGIMTTYKEAWKSLNETLIPAILHDIYKGDAAKMNKMHHFDVAYNYSFKERFKESVPAMLLDLVESYGQLTHTDSAWWIVDQAKSALSDLALKPVKVVSGYGVKQISKVFMKYGLDEWISQWLAKKVVGAGKKQIKIENWDRLL